MLMGGGKCALSDVCWVIGLLTSAEQTVILFRVWVSRSAVMKSLLPWKPLRKVPQWKPIYFLIMYILARLLFGFGMDHQAHTHWLGAEEYTKWENMIPLSTDTLLRLH